MPNQPNTSVTNQTDTTFFNALMAHLMQGAMIPKVQVERSVGPIIGFFLAEALSSALNEEIVMLCPEFPIRKFRLGESENNQSTNIDWLMFSRDKQELLLIELKTTDTSFRSEQSEIYNNLQQTIIGKNSASFLIEELDAIASTSQETGKYKNVSMMLAQALGIPGADLPKKLGQCKRARIIYIAPKISKPSTWPESNELMTWLSFGDLPEIIEHNYANHWPSVRNSLITLDTLSRRARNGETLCSDSGKNYRFLLSLEELLARCRTDGSGIVVGLINWRSSLPAMSAAQLRAKTYKCDLANDGIGKKLERNWISGDKFLEQVLKLLR